MPYLIIFLCVLAIFIATVGLIKTNQTITFFDFKYVAVFILLLAVVSIYLLKVEKEKQDNILVRNAVINNLPLPKEYDYLVDKYEYELTKEAYYAEKNKDVVVPTIILD